MAPNEADVKLALLDVQFCCAYKLLETGDLKKLIWWRCESIVEFPDVFFVLAEQFINFVLVNVLVPEGVRIEELAVRY